MAEWLVRRVLTQQAQWIGVKVEIELLFQQPFMPRLFGRVLVTPLLSDGRCICVPH
jgi:hypothetical protein